MTHKKPLKRWPNPKGQGDTPSRNHGILKKKKGEVRGHAHQRRGPVIDHAEGTPNSGEPEKAIDRRSKQSADTNAARRLFAFHAASLARLGVFRQALDAGLLTVFPAEPPAFSAPTRHWDTTEGDSRAEQV